MTNQNALNPTVPPVPRSHAHSHPHAHEEGHGHDHGHEHDHAHEHSKAKTADACCGCSSTASHGPIPLAPDVGDVPKGALLFRIPTMDCAVEESEIRRALEPIAGVKALRFRLGERTMAITTDDGVLPEALAEIGRASCRERV